MTEEFIQKAIEVHGDKYDYSKTEYVNNLKEVIIICKEHGVFLQLPKIHKRGAGCYHCGINTLIQKKQKTTQQFIEEAILIHGDTYDYSKTKYVKSSQNVIIICKIHGVFLQTPSNHLRGANCRKCAFNMTIFSTDEFIQKAKEVHQDMYDYSKSIYTKMTDNVIITCQTHGDFEQLSRVHLRGSGCKICSNNYNSNTFEFIQKAKELHGDTYDYSKVQYKNARSEILIICPIHGEFLQTPNKHLCGNGCTKCGRNMTIFSIDEFIQKAKEVHPDMYDYSKSIYTKMTDKVIITCQTHGDFQQTPSNHITHRQGCPICINKTEAKIYENIVSNYPNLQPQFKQNWCKKIRCLPYDFCIPEYKIIIELDGPQHHRQISNWSSPEEQFENDKYKEECANQNGYSIIRLLQEDVFYDSYDWVKELCEAIEEIKSSNEITNIYLCNNDEYDQF